MLGEVVTAFAASGRAADEAAAKRLAELAPGSVRRVVLARLGQLSSAAMALARAAAVLGDGAPLHQAALLAELDPGAAAAAADGLVAVEVFAAGNTLAFRHPLHRAAVLDDIGGFTRSDLYRRAARLVASDGMFERAGALLLRTAPGGDRGAVATLRRAAAIARGSGDAPTTIRLLERALAERPARMSGPRCWSNWRGRRSRPAIRPRSSTSTRRCARSIAPTSGRRSAVARAPASRAVRVSPAARLAEQALAEAPAGGTARERFEATWLLAAASTPSAHRTRGGSISSCSKPRWRV